ncbi:conserved hypothetical protein [delta proteobacterium NaphS2]|nr:conserved hypothetical protein [delta proteobacterium NaphS2]
MSLKSIHNLFNLLRSLFSLADESFAGGFDSASFSASTDQGVMGVYGKLTF